MSISFHEANFPHISPPFGHLEVRNIPVVAKQGAQKDGSELVCSTAQNPQGQSHYSWR
jgi:hypothetical protein